MLDGTHKRLERVKGHQSKWFVWNSQDADVEKTYYDVWRRANRGQINDEENLPFDEHCPLQNNGFGVSDFIIFTHVLKATTVSPII